MGLWGALGFLTLAGALVLYFFNPTEHGFYPYCVLYRTTGVMCAGCGSLRALYSLLHGEFAAAFHFNPLFVACLPLMLFLAGRAALRGMGMEMKPLQVRPWWMWAGFAVLVFYTIARNL